MDKQKVMDELRKSLGPLYDVFDNIVYVDEKGYEELDSDKKNLKALMAKQAAKEANELFQKIDQKVKSAPDDEKIWIADCHSNALLTALIKCIKSYVIKEDWHLMSQNICIEVSDHLGNWQKIPKKNKQKKGK